MKKIVIDARGYQTTTGRYMRKLIEYLEKLEGESSSREYIVLLHKREFNDYQPGAPNFTKLEADFSWRNTTHLGTEYAALLVEPDFQPPAETSVLPGAGGVLRKSSPSFAVSGFFSGVFSAPSFFGVGFSAIGFVFSLRGTIVITRRLSVR